MELETGEKSFKIRNKETRRIRFLIDSKNDIKCFSEHYEEELYECLGEGDVECPFCKRGVTPQIGIYIQLCTECRRKAQIWHTTSLDVYYDLIAYFEKYGSLSGMIFEVTRLGGRSLGYTYYNIKPVSEKSDGKTRADFDVTEITEYPYRNQIPQHIFNYLEDLKEY